MPHTDFAEGVYTIVSVRTPNLVVDTKYGKALANQFLGCETQQWELAKVMDLMWSIRNIASGRYLGMEPDDKVTNRHELREVERPFLWQLRRGDPRSCVSLFVPFTNYVIDLSIDNWGPNPGTVLYIHSDLQWRNQQWYMCKDLHLATSNALKDGTTYSIINAYSKTAIDLNRRTVTCYTACKSEDCQKFIAVKTESGWAFRNIIDQAFLGLPHSAEDGARLQPVKHTFTWVVLPHHEDNSKFKIWIPFTSRVLDLHCGSNMDGTPIHIQPDRNHEFQWWRFEPESNSKPKNALRPCTPGPPE
ncbi:hypothetical protein BKA70DRAFT_1489950 [Coprinopsis sp. MPI-PUGE-AT-0042]|nr:hypothetical protein BKA70DRAFT_1489950 [Coprinopsis sp. MPI-PUGE-AT-0042]